jgi:hypothetical protein
MIKECPKCGAKNEIEEITPYSECPVCGIIYVKYQKLIEQQSVQQEDAKIENEKTQKKAIEHTFFKSFKNFFRKDKVNPGTQNHKDRIASTIKIVSAIIARAVSFFREKINRNQTMSKYFFMRSALAFISDGRIFTGITTFVLRVTAILLGLGALMWFEMWKLWKLPSFIITLFWYKGMLSASSGLLYQFVFVVGTYMVIHTFWIRAKDVQGIHAHKFIVIPILSILLKMLGEVGACISLTIGVSAAIARLFQEYLMIYTPDFHQLLWLGQSQNDFIMAVFLTVGGAITAVFWLFLFYLSSEMLVVVVEIAKNTKALRNIAELYTETEGEK